MLAIFHDMVEKTMEVFMDDFSVFGNSFENCLSRLEKMLQRCEDTNLCLNWEKSHFMVKEGIVLGHKISKNGIEVDKAKIDVIAKLPHPTTVKGVRSFLGHAGTDISQKDEKPSKKRQNRTRDGKVCEDEAQSKSRADYANLGNFIYKRKKGEKENEKKKDVEGLFLHYRINLSQLSVIAAAKVSHFEILCHVHGIEPTVGLFRCFYVNSKNKRWMSFSKRSDSDVVCYTKPLDSLKHWNDHFFWVDSFVCPASFSWHTGKNVSRDPFIKSTEFNADYAVLVAHPAPFRKFLEPFLCLVGMSCYYTLDEDTYPSFLHDDITEMDLSAFIHVVDPTKVKVVERERAEGEAKLLESTVGRVVPLLLVVPAHVESELEASVDKLFDEGGSTEHGDSAAGGGNDAGIELVTGVENIAAENVITDGAATGSKSSSVLKELLASSILNVEVGVAVVVTLPLVTTSVSATPERKTGAPTDSITGLNLCTIGASERFVISLDYSHHSSTNASGAEGDSIIRSIVVPPVMTEVVVTSHAVNAPSILVPQTSTKITSPVHASMFHDSDSTETVKANVAGPSYSVKQDLSMGSRDLNAETLHQVFVSQWNVLNDSLLDDSDVSREFVDHLAPPALFSHIREIDYHHLFTGFNVGTARQACLNAEVRMRTEYCLCERKRLESECKSQADLLKAKDVEIENLKAQLLLKEAEAAKAIRLRVQVSATEAAKKVHAGEIDALKQKNSVLENERDSLNGKITELQSLISAKDLELKDVNVVASSFKSQNDGLVDQVHALETTCSSLRDQVSGYERLKEQIEEFQDAQMNIVNDKVAKLDADLLEMALHLEEKFYPHLLTTIFGQRWLLTHGLKLVVVKCLNSPEYLTALRSAISCAIEKGMQIGFSHKGASDADIMDLLRLESPLTDAPGMSDLQPNVEQLTLPIHRPEDQVRSAFIDVWVPLVDPLSAENLIGTSSTSSHMPTAIVTTTALSTTFASASSVPPITTDDYEIVCTDGRDDV
ncbi:hypothetical protein Tco_0007808 [Tanacetum coccineum]